MRHVPFHVIGAETVAIEQRQHRAGHLLNRMPEHFFSGHVQVPDGLGRAGPTIGVEHIDQRTIGVHLQVDDAAMVQIDCVVSLHNQCAGAVAKQHAGRAVFPIQNPAHGLSTNHQRSLHPPGAQQSVCGADGVDETGANRLNIHRHGASRNAQGALNHGGDRGEGEIRRGCGEDNAVNIASRDACVFQRIARRVNRER